MYNNLILFNFREKQIRVFVFGDYEFLCAIYGITGATGEYIFNTNFFKKTHLDQIHVT